MNGQLVNNPFQRWNEIDPSLPNWPIEVMGLRISPMDLTLAGVALAALAVAFLVLYATLGVMRVETEAAGFVVPPGRALWVPAGRPHAVSMQGGVAMRALFVRRDAAASGPAATTISNVMSRLLLHAHLRHGLSLRSPAERKPPRRRP